MTLPPPWDGVKGETIDGGVVFRLPLKTPEEVDALRRLLDAEPTLREKRGKRLTYDLVSFFDLVSDDLEVVKNTIGMFRAEGFLVKIEGESNGVLRVSTISPRGFEQRLKQEYNLESDDQGRWRLTSKAGGTRSSAPENVEIPPVTNASPAEVVPEIVPPVVMGIPSVVVQEHDHPAETNVPPPAAAVPERKP